MEENHFRRRRRPPGLVWPVILITIGVLILLSNLDMLHINVWGLWRLWPVLLILVGLEILLGRRSPLWSFIVLIVTIVVVAGVVLLLVNAPGVLGPTASGGVDRIAEPLGTIEQADLQINFAAGQLNVDQLTDSSSLVEGTLNLATQNKPVWTINRSGDRASMTLGYPEGQSFSTFTGGDELDGAALPGGSLFAECRRGRGWGYAGPYGPGHPRLEGRCRSKPDHPRFARNGQLLGPGQRRSGSADDRDPHGSGSPAADRSRAQRTDCAQPVQQAGRGLCDQRLGDKPKSRRRGGPRRHRHIDHPGTVARAGTQEG
jgi:hypothetical protein